MSAESQEKTGIAGQDILNGIFQLLAAYYVFDINFPRMYSMFLAILHILVVGEKAPKEMSRKFNFFVKTLHKEIESLPPPEVADKISS